MWFGIVLALFAVPAGVSAQQQAQQSQQGQSQQSSASTSQQSAPPATQTTQAPPVQEDSLAAVARRAREQKKDQPKSAKTFTNDNIPNQGGISVVGSSAAASAADNSAGTPATGSSPTSGTDEKNWRDKFAKLRHKLEQDQQELSVMERELGVLNVQYYNDPVKAMQQQLTRDDINKKTSDIEAKKQQIEADKQAISDAEDDLRKSGGDVGWSR